MKQEREHLDKLVETLRRLRPWRPRTGGAATTARCDEVLHRGARAGRVTRAQLDREREAAVEVIRLISEAGSLVEMVRRLTLLLKIWSDCSAVGVRLKEGDDYPYFETSGFPEAFLEGERRLCPRDADGRISRDERTNPVPDCMCRNVIQGPTDPGKPFFTQHGSFWTNSTTSLLATEADRQAWSRNHCNGRGYESVALVPLRAGQEAFGLLQFNDRRAGRFDRSLIAFLERFADNIALALAQREAYEALRASEERYRSIFEASMDAVILGTPGGSILAANESACRMFGYTLEEILRWTPHDVLDMDDPKTVAAMRQRDATGRFSGELGFHRKDGTRFIGDVSSSLFKDRAGRYQACTIIRDVTEKTETQEALRRSEERCRALLEGAGDAIFIADPETGLIVDANRKAAELIGRPVSDIVGMHQAVLHPPEDEERVRRQFKEDAEGFSATHKDSFVLHRDGRKIPVEVSAGLVTAGDRRLLHGIFRDVTERKRNEQVLRESQKRFQRLFDQSSIGAALVSLEQRYLRVNQELCRITGYTEQELLRLKFTDITHPDDMQKDVKLFRDLVAGRIEKNSLDKRYVRKDGKVVWVRLSVRMMRDDYGKPLYALPTMEDITERKEAERRLARLNETYLSFGVDPVANIDRLVALCGELLGAASSAYYREDGSLVCGWAGRSLPKRRPGGVSHERFRAATHGTGGRDKLTVVRNVLEIPGTAHARGAPGSGGPHTMVGVPVVLETQPAGVLCAFFRGDYEPRDDDERVMGLLASSVAIEEKRRAAEEAFEASEEQLRSLSAHLEKVREGERKRIAAEVHDELGQVLTVAKMELSGLKKRLPPEHGVLRDKVESMAELLDSAMQTVKRVASELRPGMLDDLGIAAAVEWQASEFSARTGIVCRVRRSPEDLVMDPDRSTALFRTLQEALTNVLRHAGASRVSVSLRKVPGRVTLEVRDNGKGITQERAVDPGSLGLAGMRERVRQWNGKLSITGRPGRGTSVTVTIPIEDKEERAE